jgi:Ca2+-binding RTX toxin-like protein
VTGLGQAVIRYLGFREVVLLLGSGDDAFHVQDLPDFLVVTISGGAGNDRFTLDRSQRVSIDGGEGSDSLAILGRAAHGWVISGINKGSVRQLKTTRSLDFEGIESLVSGRGRDIFTLNRGARLTGRVHGGGGIDELVIPRDARVRALGQSLRRIVTEGLVTEFASVERLKRSLGTKPLRA